jgi:hypothetical protein
VYLPYWLLTLIAGGLALALNRRRALRFSLKDMLAATTGLAVVLCLGLAAATWPPAFYWRLL